MWPGPEGGGPEGGGVPDPASYSLSIPEGGPMDPADSSQHLSEISDDRTQKPHLDDHRKTTQSQGTKSRLALLQSRTKSKRESTMFRSEDRTRKLDQADSSKQSDGKNPVPADKKRQPFKANKGKVNMVREQLQQNRLRFERRGQELDETAKTMEVKLEQLRQQLEERDVSIQQLQSGEIPAVEIEPEPVDLNEILKERDAKLAELTQKTADLENTILDMQENLKEKDEVIVARTQAITLLSEDMAKKQKKTVDSLEETRQQMKIMQENFIGIEAGLTAEIEQLSKTLETKNQKLQQLEFNFAQAEEVRVELMVRNSQLEEKLAMASQSGENAEEFKTKVEELSNLLDEANKKGVALQAEKKALSKQLKSFKKGTDVNEEIIKLQNHVAELEEEKASESVWQKRVEELELKLRQQDEDLENHVHMITLLESDKLEVLANFHEQSRELEELRNYISDLEKGKAPETRPVDLDEQWSVVTSPKSEDSALLQEASDAARRVAEAEKKVAEQDELIQELKSKLAQMKSDRDNQQAAIASLPSKDPEDQESIVAELKLALKESKGALEEWKSKCERVEDELELVSNELRKKEKDFTDLSGKLALYEKSLTFKVEDAEKDLQNKKIQLQELEEFVGDLAGRFEKVQESSQSHNSEPQIEEVTEVSEIVEVVEVHTPLENQEEKSSLRKEDEALHQAADSLKLELQRREATVSELKKLLEEKSNLVVELERQMQVSVLSQEEQRDKIAEAESVIEKLRAELTTSQGSSQDFNVSQDEEVVALKGALELKNEECERLEVKLRTQAEKLKKAMVNLKAKTVANNDLTDKVTKLQNAIESNQALVDNLSKDKNEILEKWQTETSEKVEIMNALANVKYTLEEKEREVFELTKLIGMKDHLLTETKVELDDKVVQVAELEASLTEKLSQLTALEERLTAPAAELREQEGGEDTAKDAQIIKLQNVAKSYKVKLAKEKKAHSEVEEKLTLLEQTLADKSAQLEESLEKISQHNHAYEAKVQEYEAYVDSLKQELDRERHQLCHLSESFADTEHRCKNLENYCQKLEQQIGEAHQQGANELENELNRRRLEAEDRERSMVRELHNVREENKELKQNLCETELRVKALEMELSVAVARMADMEKEAERRAVWEEEANKTANVCFALEAKIRNMLREHKQQLDDQVAETNQVRESLQSELDDSREHISKLEAELNLLRDQFNVTTRAEQELSQEIQQKDTEIEEMRQVMTTVEDQRKQQVAEMTADIENYKIKVTELESATTTTAHLFPEGGDCLDETSSASARISELNTTVEALTGELEIMKAQAKKYEDFIDERPSIPQELDTHVTASQLMTSMNNMVMELEAELNQVWSERDQALAQIDQLMNNSLPRDESFVYNMDESLMEKNMNKLESELSGMVTSQQEGVQRQFRHADSSEGNADTLWNMEPTGQSDEDVWKWDSARAETTEHLKEKFSVLEQRIKKKLNRMSLHLKQGAGDNRSYSQGTDDSSTSHTAAEDRYQKLTTQIKDLESERNDALSQMKRLRAEVDKLTSGMEKGLPLEEASVAPTPTIESAPGWEMDDPDGWGWGDKTEEENEPPKPEETPESEETPEEKLSALQRKLNALETDKDIWESERVKLTEDLKLAQIRSVKLVKKLKEMKQKYETTKVSTSSSLDQAIEEEFAIQIKSLEKDLSEARTELTSIRADRDNLSKQVQVLTSGNERLVEMKERQDFEVEMWQKRSDELTKKVNALEWEVDEWKTEKTDSGEKLFGECQRCGELEKQLAVLSEESEALQAVLTKQKEDQLTVAKSGDMNPVAVEQLVKETHTWSSKYETLMQEYQQVRAQCISDTEKITTLELVVAELTAAVERLENEKKYLQDVHDSLKMEFETVNAQLKQSEVLVERRTREAELSAKHLEDNLLREKYEEVCSENEQIRDRCRKLEDEIKEVAEAGANGSEVEQLKYHLTAQSADLTAKEQSIGHLEAEVSVLRTQLESAVNEANVIQSERSRLADELNALRAETNELKVSLELEIAQLRKCISDQENVLASRDRTIDTLEADLLDARTQLKSVYQAEFQQREDMSLTEFSGARAETSAVAIAQPEVRSTADWFSSQSIGQDLLVGTPPTSVLNWDAIVTGNTGADVFDTIQKTSVSVTTQAPVPASAIPLAELEAKEAELQKMTRLVETLKLTHSEAEQEWNQAIEYTKNQLAKAVEDLESVREMLSVRERELLECQEAFERSSQSYQEKLHKRDGELKEKECQIEALRAHIAERENRLGALQEGELSQLNLQLAEKDQLILQVQAKRDHDLAEANQQITDLKTKLSQKEWQMTEITMARERELAMRDEAKGKELKEQIAGKNLQLSLERQRLQSQIEVLQMTADQQGATIHQLQSQLAADSPALEEMRLYAEEQSKTAEELRNQLQTINQELNDTRQYSHQQATTLHNLQLQQQSAEEELGMLRQSQNKMIELEEEMEQLKKTVIHRGTTIERLQSSIEWLEQERATLVNKEDFIQMESTLALKENELSLLRQEIVMKEEFVVKLQAEVQAKDTEIQELQDKIQRLEMKRMWDAEVKANREAAAKLEQTASSGVDAAVRSDLDQALNMLHQRDVRCEELTLELMRLLEERDSLQLRLSSAIRLNEDLRSKLKQFDNSPNASFGAPFSNQGLQQPVATSSVDSSLSATDGSVDTDADGNMQGLANKLAELKRVGYSRDVRIKDESELRHKEQMRLITSSPSMFSPPAISIVSSSHLTPSHSEVTTVEGTGAAVDLVPSNSEAQDEQSSSLLDWFLGRR